MRWRWAGLAVGLAAAMAAPAPALAQGQRTTAGPVPAAKGPAPKPAKPDEITFDKDAQDFLDELAKFLDDDDPVTGQPFDFNARSIKIGDNKQASLMSGDSVGLDGDYYDTYDPTLKAGQAVTITMTSPDFDAYLSVAGPKQKQQARNDDGGGGTNARLSLTAKTDGDYRITAGTLKKGKGAYKISVE